MLAEHEKDPTKIRRLNHTGTHPVHTDLTINDSISYLEMIGLERKESRLRFIQRYWSDSLRTVENVIVNTPNDENRSCRIANVGLTNMNPLDIAKALLDEVTYFKPYYVILGLKTTTELSMSSQHAHTER